jgi:SAM-dependent methyltransferase
VAALAPTLSAQALGEMAAEAKRKKQESTRPVLTNDDLSGRAAVPAPAPGPGWPSIRVLPESPDPPQLAPFMPTPIPIVEAMLELVGVRADDVVFDIGSGDGRIVIAAAERFGARGVGIEIDPNLVGRSRKLIEDKGLADRVQIIHANALDVDLGAADVVTLFLTPSGNETLRPHLEESLRRGVPVVSRDFPIVGWELVEERVVMGATLYLYRVP